MFECKKALNLFDDNIIQAKEYIKMKGHAVCRQKKMGIWNIKDFVDCIKMRNFIL